MLTLVGLIACGLARGSLAIRPGATLVRALQCPGELPALSDAQLVTVKRVHRAIRRASRYVLGSKRPCLPEAVATRWLLTLVGVPARLRIGTNADGSSFAHAWVECADGLVVGSAARLADKMSAFNWRGGPT